MHEKKEYMGQVEEQSNKRGVYFKERDLAILQAIHARDGMLSLEHITRLFFEKYLTAKRRMSKLWNDGVDGYVARPEPKVRAGLNDMPYWLSERGAQKVAEAQGIDFKDFKYRKKTRTDKIDHDFKINTFRIDVEEAVRAQAAIEFDRFWVTSFDFDLDSDCIQHRTPNKGRGRRCMKPDGFFAIVHEGLPFPSFLEIDNGTEDNSRFGSEKILPGIAYLMSEEYRIRFGYNSGRFLIVTTGHIRRNNMKKNAESVIRRAYKDEKPERFFKTFLFSTFEDVTPETVLTKPIWYPIGFDEPVALLERI